LGKERDLVFDLPVKDKADVQHIALILPQLFGESSATGAATSARNPDLDVANLQGSKD